MGPEKQRDPRGRGKLLFKRTLTFTQAGTKRNDDAGITRIVHFDPWVKVVTWNLK